MRKSSKIALSVVLIAVVPVIGILLYLRFGDLTVHKGYFEAEISEAIGHDVAINGLFELQVGNKVLFTAEDVSASNPKWDGDSEYASAERIHFLVDTRSIFGDTIDIDVLELTGIRADLHERADGQANWQPNLTKIQMVAVEHDREATSPLLIHHVALDDIVVSYEKEDEVAQRLAMESLRLDRDPDGAMRVDFAGSYAAGTVATPFIVKGEIRKDDPRLLISDTTVDLEGGSFGVNGWIDPDGEAVVDVVAEGNDLSALRGTFAADGLPGLPYSLSVQVAAEPNSIVLKDLRLAVGEGEITGSILVGLDQEKPHIAANIISSLLDLRTPESAAEEPVQANDEPEAATIFSDEPLNISWLDSANIGADVSITSVMLNDDRLDDFNFRVVLEDGALTVDPFGFSSGDGGLSGHLVFQPEQGQHALSVAVTTENLRLGALAIDGQGPEMIPPLNLKVELGGRGSSVHEIMSSATGSVSGRQNAGQINLQAVGILFSDLVTSILRTLNPLAETETVTNLECGVYEANISDGNAVIERLALQTDRLTIVGSGDIDLSTEKIDLSLRTKTREGLGVSLGGVVNSFLKVSGTLKEPSIGVDAAGSVTTTGAAVATGGLSVLAKGLWDRVSAEVDICSDDSNSENTPKEEPQQ
jgi:uncharacterized protein involved in outer membrane biogenesis